MTTTLRGPALLGGDIVDAEIDVSGDRIIALRPTSPGQPATPGAVPVSGTMTAAYVDQHCHGGGGSAFTDLDPDAAAASARHHHARGSTSLIASLVSMSPADLERGVSILADLTDDRLIDGIHLEGPWLAQARCGAHDPALLRDPELAEVERLLALGRGHIKHVTLAPERDHGLDLVTWLTSAGVHAAIGHTTASYGEVGQAIEAGADLATHLFNGMDPWHHRKPGAVPALLRAAARDGITLELIADGAHLSDDTVRTVLDLVGPARVVFVSDAIAAAGIGDGPYVLGGVAVLVTDGIARLQTAPGEPPGSISGGTSHVADIVAHVVGSGQPLAYAAVPATSAPAGLLGLADRGVLAVGARADLLLLDEAARVTRVMRAGRWLPPEPDPDVGVVVGSC
ncbi:MAG: amidohydrolase family protein, partial [Micrococcales bacterium]|nr:amidohydrolase family protein [Micrococcales bacterium]